MTKLPEKTDEDRFYDLCTDLRNSPSKMASFITLMKIWYCIFKSNLKTLRGKNNGNKS